MFYLNFILPPIIIVASVAVVLFIISRKSLSEDIIKEDEESGEKTEGIGADIKHGSLSILEKTARWFKILSLKLHNSTEKWLKSIRQKKEDVRSVENIKSVENVENIESNGRKKKRIMVDDFGKKSSNNKIHKIKRSIVSKKVVYPENFPKKKLESALIERIAVDPRDVEAYQKLGELYLKKESWNDAKECYKQVIKLTPKNTTATNKMKEIERHLSASG